MTFINFRSCIYKLSQLRLQTSIITKDFRILTKAGKVFQHDLDTITNYPA